MTLTSRHVRLAVPALSALPAVCLAIGLAAGRYSDPVGAIVRITGRSALALLLLSLLPTAVRVVHGSAALLPLRRGIGLAAAGYAFVHAAAHIMLGYGLQPSMWFAALRADRFVAPGLLAALLLAALAVTSGTRARRRLGRWWRPLRRSSYLASAAAVIHALASSKTPRRVYVLAAAVWAAFLVVRLPSVQRALGKIRRRA